MSTIEHEELVLRPVKEIMSSPVFVIDARLPLGEALAALVRAGLRHLAVVDEGERCIGVIADRAVAAAWAASPAALDFVAIADVLDRRPSVVGVDATLGEVAQAMHTDGVDAVAVIDRRGRPVGMVTGGDLIAVLAHHVPVETTVNTQDPEEKDRSRRDRDLRPGADTPVNEVGKEA